MDYLIFSNLLDLNKLYYDSFEEEIQNSNDILDEMEVLESEFRKLFEDLNPLYQDQVLTKYIRSLLNIIFELHNELENRDSFMRIYSENFTNPAKNKTFKNKVLYDEKEWRSIKYADSSDYEEALNNRYLPPKYNLLFGDNDVLAILLKDKTTSDVVKNYIQKNPTLLDPIVDRLIYAL